MEKVSMTKQDQIIGFTAISKLKDIKNVVLTTLSVLYEKKVAYYWQQAKLLNMESVFKIV